MVCNHSASDGYSSGASCRNSRCKEERCNACDFRITSPSSISNVRPDRCFGFDLHRADCFLAEPTGSVETGGDYSPLGLFFSTLFSAHFPLPMTFIAAPYERDLSVTTPSYCPYRFIAILINIRPALYPSAYGVIFKHLTS